MNTPDHTHAPSEPCGTAAVPADLRDRFAGLAMQAIVSSIDSEANYERLRGHARAAGLTLSQWISRDAYKQADAMLAERQVRP